MRKLTLAAALMSAAAVPTLAQAAPAAPVGDLIVDMRLRAERVDQTGLPEDALALTLRTRLGYETPAWRGFRLLAEGENVTALKDDYNSTTNRRLAYPVVADPETTELNRLQVAWTGKQADAVIGRQRLVLGNARYVGNVGFRQNEQTFDALRAGWRPSRDVTLTYAYVDRVHRVFGDDSPQGEWDSDSHILQAEMKTPLGQAAAFAQLLAFENAPAQSGATWGLRLAGARPLSGAWQATYEAEYARQTDYRNSPTDYQLDYVSLSGGVKTADRFASLNLERLDGDGRRGFQTPLATLHAFQGWADVFLTTPATGIRDVNLKVGGVIRTGPKAQPLKLQAVLHDFDDADGGRDLGRELDLVASLPLTKQVTAEVKAAVFEGDQPAFADRSKLWVSLEMKY